jgi:hypothetical protein
MEFQSLTAIISDECKRLQRNKKMEREVREAFETAPNFDDIPINLQKKFDEQMFFSDGPEVTTPAEKFTFDY